MVTVRVKKKSNEERLCKIKNYHTYAERNSLPEKMDQVRNKNGLEL